jgi:tRNA(adenine34) deaminase
LTDEEAMRLALAEAESAAAADDVPVGAVVLRDGELLASAGNRREQDGDPTAHAEILALRAAAARAGTWRLDGATMVITLEPCPMCAGALVNARVARVVYGCDDPKAGAARTLFRICDDPRLNHRLEVVGGVLADECAAVLRRFFAERRSAR